MTDGAQASRKISRALTHAEGDATRDANILTELHNTESTICIEMANVAKRLASLHINEIASGRLRLTDFKAHDRVAANLSRRNLQLARLNTELEARVDRRKPLLAAVTAAAEVREKVQAAISAANAELKQVQAIDPELSDISTRRIDTDQSVAALHERYLEARADLDTKGAAYHADPLFSYLLKRGYGTGAYRSRGFIKACDAHVADRCKFDQVYSKYQLLQQLPEFVAEHLRAAQDRSNELARQADARLLALAQQHIPSNLEGDLRAAVADERAAQGSLDAMQREIDRLGAEIATYANYTDPLGREMTADLKCVYDDTMIDELEAIATTTDDPEDDELVAQLKKLRSRRSAVMSREPELADNARKSAEKAKRLRDFNNQFRQNRRATSSYRYDDGALDGFITGVLLGNLTSSSAADQLGQAAREIERSTYPWGGSYSSSGRDGGRSDFVSNSGSSVTDSAVSNADSFFTDASI